MDIQYGSCRFSLQRSPSRYLVIPPSNVDWTICLEEGRDRFTIIPVLPHPPPKPRALMAMRALAVHQCINLSLVDAETGARHAYYLGERIQL